MIDDKTIQDIKNIWNDLISNPINNSSLAFTFKDKVIEYLEKNKSKSIKVIDDESKDFPVMQGIYTDASLAHQVCEELNKKYSTDKYHVRNTDLNPELKDID